jgi:hypothetical protein
LPLILPAPWPNTSVGSGNWLCELLLLMLLPYRKIELSSTEPPSPSGIFSSFCKNSANTCVWYLCTTTSFSIAGLLSA